MDLRIVNTCNNSCLFCLEQLYRTKALFIEKDIIIRKIIASNDKLVTFYWWNPLLHPDILEIINFCRLKWFHSIWILTNTFWIDKSFLDSLIKSWLTSIWFYFNSFDKKRHDIIVNSWISYSAFLNNIKLISESWLHSKAIVHVNWQNIDRLYKDIYILNTKYNIRSFEFINYFPFDRPYEKYEDILSYDICGSREYIDNLFGVIINLGLSVNFVKFRKDFFWTFTDFYDYRKWILQQMWKTDKFRLSLGSNPFCKRENRCEQCFIKDYCDKKYGEI